MSVRKHDTPLCYALPHSQSYRKLPLKTVVVKVYNHLEVHIHVELIEVMDRSVLN